MELQRRYIDFTSTLFREVRRSSLAGTCFIWVICGVPLNLCLVMEKGFLDGQYAQLRQLQDESNPEFVTEVPQMSAASAAGVFPGEEQAGDSVPGKRASKTSLLSSGLGVPIHPPFSRCLLRVGWKLEQQIVAAGGSIHPNNVVAVVEYLRSQVLIGRRKSRRSCLGGRWMTLRRITQATRRAGEQLLGSCQEGRGGSDKRKKMTKKKSPLLLVTA
ncbi:hypothetical protein BHM03_00022584 [Ensete ventricosum]|nr:hypothetical protein BHM03_00022584 [Ensete ventricosum]